MMATLAYAMGGLLVGLTYHNPPNSETRIGIGWKGVNIVTAVVAALAWISITLKEKKPVQE